MRREGMGGSVDEGVWIVENLTCQVDSQRGNA